jgi:hypothetical protein
MADTTPAVDLGEMSAQADLGDLAEREREKRAWQDDLLVKALEAVRQRRSARTIRKHFTECALSLGSGYRLSWLLIILAEMGAADFWWAIKTWWSGCDDTWGYRTRLLELLRQHHQPPPHSRHTKVYRGCSRRRVRGLSWTLEREVAEGFARGHRHIRVPDPVIASAAISNAHIFCRINSRNEREVLIDPAHLIDLSVAPMCGR